jgi:hypothetical protein
MKDGTSETCWEGEGCDEMMNRGYDIMQHENMRRRCRAIGIGSGMDNDKTICSISIS